MRSPWISCGACGTGRLGGQQITDMSHAQEGNRTLIGRLLRGDLVGGAVSLLFVSHTDLDRTRVHLSDRPGSHAAPAARLSAGRRSGHTVGMPTELTSKERKKLRKKQFALPGKRKYPIPDKAHARNALARVAQKGTPAEQRKVRAAVRKRFPSIGMGTKKKG